MTGYERDRVQQQRVGTVWVWMMAVEARRRGRTGLTTVFLLTSLTSFCT